MTQTLTLYFDFAAESDIGCKRSNNEDSYGYDTEHQLFVVCDGMGGNAAGEVASSMAVRTLMETFEASAPGPGIEDPGPVESRLLGAIFEANRVVRNAGLSTPELNRMGTTLVCACLEGDRVVVGNVGDSRAYLIRDGSCAQITEDHSLIEEEIRNGNLSPEMAGQSHLQSVITRAIGVADEVTPDLFGARLHLDDMLLLASDGLTRYASPDEIATAVALGTNMPASCRVLIELAKQKGGADNITCILLRATEMRSI